MTVLSVLQAGVLGLVIAKRVMSQLLARMPAVWAPDLVFSVAPMHSGAPPGGAGCSRRTAMSDRALPTASHVDYTGAVGPLELEAAIGG